MRRLSRPTLERELADYLDRMQSLVDSGGEIAALWKAQQKSSSMLGIRRLLASIAGPRLTQSGDGDKEPSEERVKDLLDCIDDATDYGLAAWFFLRDGQAEEVFRSLQAGFPAVWKRAVNFVAERQAIRS